MKKAYQFSKTYPKGIWIQTTNLCNYGCRMCPYAYAKKKSTYVMSEDIFHLIVENIKMMRTIKKVSFSMQNEPLCDKKIFNRIRYVKSQTNKRVMITTNGYALNLKNISQCIDSGIDEIRISINAFTTETYFRLTGNNHFYKVVQNTKNLIRRRPLQLTIVVSFVILKDNIKELNAFVDYWQNQNVLVRAYYANNKAGILKKHESIFAQKRDCSVPFNEINIRYSGDVVLCRQDWENRIVFGNIKKNTLQEIWNNYKYRNFRKRFIAYEGAIAPCRYCNRKGWKANYLDKP